MMGDFSWTQFHLLRPWWLLALLPLLIAAGLLLRRKLFSRNWQAVIDAQLLPHVLMGKPGRSSRWPVLLFLIIGSLVILALAGPVWSKLPQPVFQNQSALVIALDLSRSMDATDIKPSRLARARYKIADILKLRREGQTALIAYAASAFTVTPLTDDTATIAAMVPSLSTDIMPAQGSRTDLSLQQARQLFTNSGISHGDVLLITDGIGGRGEQAVRDMAEAGYRVSILATGSRDGAPIALANGGFLKDAQGAIVIPKLDVDALRSAARSSGGRFSLLSADDRDIKHILGLLDSNRLQDKAKATDLHADVWQEQGPWLLLLAAPLAALAFRRGYLVLLVAMLLPWSPRADALSWDSLWKNDNQIAAEKLARDQASAAAKQFTDPQWQAAAHYKAGEYAQAVQALQGMDSADAHYNQGNALARQGKLQQAIDAYDQALKKDPQLDDARYNKKLLEQQLKQQQQKNQQGNKNQDGDSKGDQQQSAKQQPGDNRPGDDQQQQQGSSQLQAGQNKGDQPQDQQQSGQQQGQQPQQDKPADDSQQQASGQQPNDKQQPAGQQDQSQQDQAQQGQQADSDEQDGKPSAAEQQSSQDLSQQATEQWLRRIPDDPGGLLRRKFKYQYQRQQGNGDETQPW